VFFFRTTFLSLLSKLKENKKEKVTAILWQHFIPRGLWIVSPGSKFSITKLPLAGGRLFAFPN
jgi:hypothetical protein